MGRRAKWKDYVDLDLMFRKYSLAQVVRRTKELFGAHFNERMLREQLVYYKDVSFKEKVEFMPGFERSEKEIKQELRRVAVS